MSMITIYKCPSCKTEFEKLGKGGLCPNFECRAPLKYVEREDDSGISIRDVEYRKPKDSFEDEAEIYEVVYRQTNVKVEKSNKGNFIVTFIYQMNFNWIYCPSCESKMFQNNRITGSFEHKCHKCKAVTTYVFL